MNTFPVRRVGRDLANAVEPLGSKPKFWFHEGGRRLLFKAEDRGTGEDWAEMVSCCLCELMGLPHVQYELAAEYEGDQYRRPGVVCENMAPRPTTLVLGNQLLLDHDAAYPATQRFKVRQHTVDAVVEVVGQLTPPAPDWMRGTPGTAPSALDIFLGYIMLDAWIANQDRHHENWGALVDGDTMGLAPTFDHGAALARNLTDRERHDRLTTRDRNRTVEAFARAGRSRFYATTTDSRALGTLDAFEEFALNCAGARRVWLKQLEAVDGQAISAILERVPDDRMTPVCREFTLELLLTNQQRLLA
jgi:hypothetical protein